MELPDDVQDLVRQLQQERQALVNAWEKLEQEQRRLSAQCPVDTERNFTAEITPQPPVNSVATRGTPPCSLSRQSQFQQLQREIDRRST